jgi:putative transposase
MRRSSLPDVRTWHVFSRGARRLALFYEDGDDRQFLLYLREALILSGCALFAYVLMGNHYHLMLRGAQTQITDCMKRLNWRYALYHNDRRRLGGHVFDGSYKEYPQRTLMWLLWRLAYIFMNPVKAAMVGEAQDYPWSGFRSFMGQEGSPMEVSPLPELLLAGYDLADIRASVLRLMEEQRTFGKNRGSSTPTAREIQLDQFEWVRRQAEARAQQVPDFDAETLAFWWGKELGVPPAVMLPSLGGASRHEFRRRIQRLEKMLKNDEALTRKLTL